MAAIIWTDVLDLAPEVTSVDAQMQTFILADANNRFDVDVFGGEGATKLHLARVYLAAHLATLVLRGNSVPTGQVGPVTSQTVGPFSESYAQPSYGSNPSDLSSTTYGQMLKGLIWTSTARLPFVL